MTTSTSDPNWWRQAVVYQVYPRSFADANADGIGDLAGVLSRVDYLSDLGVDAVWLSPFYPSALADGGYDVDDYCDVDPKLGTLADFDAMVAALHEAGIKVIVDIVPNHTSDRHAWFREALASEPGSAARDRYIFRDGKGPDGSLPPSDWESNFGGPAWQRVPDEPGAGDDRPAQWYLHLFAPEQPDLNWDNRQVRDDFLEILRFWGDRGVDGFRVDVAHGLAKDLTEPLATLGDLAEHAVDLTLSGKHPIWDRDDVHDIYREWRKVFDEYDPPLAAVAEAWVLPSRRGRYASPEGLGQAFNFDLLEAEWSAEGFRTIITRNLDEVAETGTSSTWVLSNHDVVRHPSRYGLGGDRDRCDAWLLDGGSRDEVDLERGLRRARAATMLILALPGSTYLYQGEELGLHEVGDIPDAERQDPTWQRSGHTRKGRDGARVPLPWTQAGPSYGFGEGGAHLPQPDWFGPVSVEAERDDPDSTLSLYREALRLRRALQTDEQLTWLADYPESVVAFSRPGGWQSVTNMGSDPVALPEGEPLLASGPLEGGFVPPDTTAWVHRPAG
ncbi:MAG TPA: glycoside hydrolase family 13 protein [Nocardioidaceae bacterium]|nr:glycoside hydrolase family 13 protein [Nocardioidaceae bacterium]